MLACRAGEISSSERSHLFSRHIEFFTQGKTATSFPEPFPWLGAGKRLWERGWEDWREKESFTKGVSDRKEKAPPSNIASNGGRKVVTLTQR